MRSFKLCCLATALLLATAGVAVAGSNSLTVVTNNPPGNANCQGQTGGCQADASCVQEGEYAMRVRAVDGDDSAVFVEADDSNGFSDETVVRQVFWFSPDNMTANHGAKHFVNAANRSGGGKAPFRGVYRYNGNTGEHKMLLACITNCPGATNCSNKRTGRVTLDPGFNQILLEWAHSDAAPNPANGVCRIEVIGGPAAGQEFATTNHRSTQATVAGVKLGMFGAPQSPSTDGDHCFDDYQSFRTLAP